MENTLQTVILVPFTMTSPVEVKVSETEVMSGIPAMGMSSNKMSVKVCGSRSVI